MALMRCVVDRNALGAPETPDGQDERPRLGRSNPVPVPVPVSS